MKIVRTQQALSFPTEPETHMLQDMAVAIFLAYASRRFDSVHFLASDWNGVPEAKASASMSSLALAFGAAACMGLAGYRMAYGDDHGHIHHSMMWHGRRRWRQKQQAPTLQ